MSAVTEKDRWPHNQDVLWNDSEANWPIGLWNDFWPIGLCLLSVHNPSGLTEREGTEGSTSVRKQWTLTTQV